MRIPLANKKDIVRCWDFFHCISDEQKKCLMSEVEEWRCWMVNIACCKINQEAPRPISVKNVFCKTCSYFKEYGHIA